MQQPRESSNSFSSQSSRSMSATTSPHALPNQFYPNFAYPYPMDYGQPMAQSTSHDGSPIPPSSPSFTASIPGRRPLQRSPASTNGVAATTIRSQSQPAPKPPSQKAPNAAKTPVTPVTPGYEGGGSYYQVPAADMMHGFPIVDSNNVRPMMAYFDARIPVAHQSPSDNGSKSETRPDERSKSESNSAAPTPGSRISRSPSPNHSRHKSTPLRTTPLPPVPRFNSPNGPGETLPQSAYSNPAHAHMMNGLLIVNGSSYVNPTAESNRIYSSPTGEESTSPKINANDNLSHETNGTFNGLYSPSQATPGYPHRSGDNEKYLSGYPQNPSEAGGIVFSYAPPAQGFAVYPDGTYALPTSATRDDNALTPSRSYPTAWPRKTSPELADQASPTETNQNSRSPQSVPLLSPVMETRTPSPNKMRNGESRGPMVVNGNIIGGLPSFDGLPVPPTPAYMDGLRNLAAGNTNLPSRPSPLQQQSSSSGNQWQTSENKKRSSRRRSKSGPVRSNNNESTGSVRGQPLPIRPEDRKGG
jgi:hypothetical protein